MHEQLRNRIGIRLPAKNFKTCRSTQRISSRLSLRANFSWTFFGNMVYAGCQWGMLVTMSKLVSPELVGQFALSLTITAPVYMFSCLELRNIQAADARGEYLFGDYLSLRIITTILALLVILGIVFALDYKFEVTLIVLFVGLSKAIESISDLFFGLFQQKERMDRIARSMIIKGLLSLFTLSLVVYMTRSILWGTVGLIAASTLVLLSYDIPNSVLIMKSMPELNSTTANLKKHLNISHLKNLILVQGQGEEEVQPAPSSKGSSTRIPKYSEDLKRELNTEIGTKDIFDIASSLRPRWQMNKLIKLTWFAFPMGFAAMLGSLHTNIPRYFVDRHLGAYMLGIFAALAYFDRAGRLVMHALGQSGISRLSRYYATGKVSEFGSLLFRLVSIGILLGCLGVFLAFFAGKAILTFFYQPEYAIQDVFVMLMIAAGLGYVTTFLTYGVIASKYFRAQMVLNIIVTAILVLLCVFMIPSGGLQGAAKAVVIARSFEAIGAMAIAAISLFALQRKTKCR